MLAAPAEPALRLTVVSVLLSCQAMPGVPEGCQVGGSGVLSGLGKVCVYHSVRLRGTGRLECRHELPAMATLTLQEQ